MTPVFRSLVLALALTQVAALPYPYGNFGNSAATITFVDSSRRLGTAAPRVGSSVPGVGGIGSGNVQFGEGTEIWLRLPTRRFRN